MKGGERRGFSLRGRERGRRMWKAYKRCVCEGSEGGQERISVRCRPFSSQQVSVSSSIAKNQHELGGFRSDEQLTFSSHMNRQCIFDIYCLTLQTVPNTESNEGLALTTITPGLLAFPTYFEPCSSIPLACHLIPFLSTPDCAQLPSEMRGPLRIGGK